MTLQWWNGIPLVVGSKMAMDPLCCCQDPGCCCKSMQDVAGCQIDVSGILDKGGEFEYFYDCDCVQWNRQYLVPRDSPVPDVAPAACHGGLSFPYTCKIKSTGQDVAMSVVVQWKVYCCFGEPPDFLNVNCGLQMSLQIAMPAGYVSVIGYCDMGFKPQEEDCLGQGCTTNSDNNSIGSFGTGPDCDVSQAIFSGVLI